MKVYILILVHLLVVPFKLFINAQIWILLTQKLINQYRKLMFQTRVYVRFKVSVCILA